ncbi:MAG: tetratricopeptide repeat protein [Massilia sp.]
MDTSIRHSRWHAWALLLACCAILAGCATPSARVPAVDALFADARYAPPPSPVGADDVFALSPAMRATLDSPAFRAQLKRLGVERGLVAALYDDGSLKLEYDAAKTRTAAEAFAARRGNCLSLVMMTAAFARALGLEVRYQQVVVDESWRRSGDMVVSSGHVNLSISRPERVERIVTLGPTPGITVDFLPGEAVDGYQGYPLDEATILAMYANNRAVEALLRNQLDEAYWWARAALQRDPRFIASYNTMAVIHQRHGDAVVAERSWRAALEREPENVVAMRNLAPLLASEGRQPEADALLKQAAGIEPYPPFYFHGRGMAALERKDYTAARSMFEREVKRAPYHDEFHFWLAIALLRLGEREQARDQLALAAQTTESPATGRLYSAKLEMLRKGAPRATE